MIQQLIEATNYYLGEAKIEYPNVLRGEDVRSLLVKKGRDGMVSYRGKMYNNKFRGVFHIIWLSFRYHYLTFSCL